SLWLSLKRLASALIRSLLPPVCACHHWISVTASAAAEYAIENAAMANTDTKRVMRMLKIMELLLGERNRTGSLPLLVSILFQITRAATAQSACPGCGATAPSGGIASA